MREPAITIRPIGHEAQPLVTLDDFASNPERLRTAAIATQFGAAAHHYPGIRAPVPDDYWRIQQPIVAAAIADAFGPHQTLTLIDSSFSIVTRRPDSLTIGQRLPHCDAFDPERIALIHYLSFDDISGTAFFRHRSTGFETVDQDRLPHFRERLESELRTGEKPSGYIGTSDRLFERFDISEARFNRALLYRSFLLHSGAIARTASLSADPAIGRLTVTAFFAIT